eukprot:gnl/TRDRNA2_/TRDRNA2_185957_c0_seq1.p1 gnl/TRDRNA2_/TRDRNA2_185957_c0~~gnl/TRDRNA2_/TRDRNA2_185957_c0_seq1.p1  ORF type:complete len:163 (+),score=16.40 gnl/TRDRNA2_/TRDRNA2_185957_c0_seq1:55-543(+)
MAAPPPGPAASQALRAQPGEWQVGLCYCLGDLSSMLLGCCCPCIITYQMVEEAASFEMYGTGMIVTKESALMWCLLVWLVGGGSAGTVLFIAILLMIFGIKKKFRITEGVLETLIKAVCCLCCYQVQILQHCRQVNAVGPPVGVAPRDGDARTMEMSAVQSA